MEYHKANRVELCRGHAFQFVSAPTHDPYYSGGFCFPIAIDLTWTSDSELTRVNDTTQFRQNGLIIVNHFNGSSRNAVAFGTISGANVSWAQGNSQQAFIGFALANSVVVQQ